MLIRHPLWRVTEEHESVAHLFFFALQGHESSAHQFWGSLWCLFGCVSDGQESEAPLFVLLVYFLFFLLVFVFVRSKLNLNSIEDMQPIMYHIYTHIHKHIYISIHIFMYAIIELEED